MSIIALTETSQKLDHISNVTIDGYSEFFTPTKYNKGGACLYVKNSFAPFERFDFKTDDDLFEGVWIEIPVENNRNIICGSVYRHPSYDIIEFHNYLENVLKKATLENKEIYICGDFNIDFLKIDERESFLLFYNMLCSFGVQPLIIHPSRIVVNQEPSLIDNILSNNVTDEIRSGNIYFSLSEHFSQFAFVKRGMVHSKKIKMYSRDFSNYSANDWRAELESQLGILSHLILTTSSMTLYLSSMSVLKNMLQ